jgi:hypothetical protein
MQGSSRFDRAWLALWAIGSSIWCLTAAPRLSATFDEPHYVVQGLHSWRTGSCHLLLRGGTMPLPMDVQMLPVYVWEQVRGRAIDMHAEFATVLQIARAGNLIFWWLLLYFSWRLGRRFGGDWAGRLTIPLIACDPTFLAHAALATTDIAISAWMVMFTELYLAGRGGGWQRRVGVPGLCYGFGLLAKASAFPFVVIVMSAIEVHRTWRLAGDNPAPGSRALRWLRSLRGETRAFRLEFWQIAGIGLVTAFLYCGCDWRPDNGFIVWAKALPAGAIHDGMVWLAERLCLFPNAGVGIAYQIQHNYRGLGVYCVGEWHAKPVWYYFPLALTMKLTLPVLALLAATVALRPKTYAHALGLLTLCLFLFTLNCRVQIGIRLVLPFITVLLVALAVALARSWPRSWPAYVRPAGLAAVCALALGPMLGNWPHGLCYFNPLWGGPEGGYRYLSDSNYDWGQGIDDLERWEQQKGRPPLKIWYYGTDPKMLGRPESTPLHLLRVNNEEDLRATVGSNYLAVGTTLLYSNPGMTPSMERALEILKTKQPVARTMTFFIYDFTEPRSLVAKP